MHQTTSAQRDRELRRERERNQRQMTTGPGGGDHASSLEFMNSKVLFGDPIKQEEDDETTKKIKSTLGDFTDFAQKCLKSQSNEAINPHLLGISTREVNRRKVEEIFSEMKNPIEPITGLDENDDVPSTGGSKLTSTPHSSSSVHQSSRSSSQVASNLKTQLHSKSSNTHPHHTNHNVQKFSNSQRNKPPLLSHPPSHSASLSSNVHDSTSTSTTVHPNSSHNAHSVNPNHHSNAPNHANSHLSDDENHPHLIRPTGHEPFMNNKNHLSKRKFNSKVNNPQNNDSFPLPPTTTSSTGNSISALSKGSRLSHSSSDSSDDASSEDDDSNEEEDDDDSSSESSESETVVNRGDDKKAGKHGLSTANSLDLVENNAQQKDVKWDLDSFIDLGLKQHQSGNKTAPTTSTVATLSASNIYSKTIDTQSVKIPTISVSQASNKSSNIYYNSVSKSGSSLSNNKLSEQQSKFNSGQQQKPNRSNYSKSDYHEDNGNPTRNENEEMEEGELEDDDDLNENDIDRSQAIKEHSQAIDNVEIGGDVVGNGPLMKSNLNSNSSKYSSSPIVNSASGANNNSNVALTNSNQRFNSNTINTNNSNSSSSSNAPNSKSLLLNVPTKKSSRFSNYQSLPVSKANNPPLSLPSSHQESSSSSLLQPFSDETNQQLKLSSSTNRSSNVNANGRLTGKAKPESEAKYSSPVAIGDENSWKDVKRRKDPNNSSNPALVTNKATSKSFLNITNNNSEFSPPDLSNEKKSKHQRKLSFLPGSKPLNKKSKFSSSSSMNNNSTVSNNNNGVKKLTSASNKSNEPSDQLIISIELPKLMRVPCVDRNGNIAKLSGEEAARRSLSTTKSKNTSAVPESQIVQSKRIKNSSESSRKADSDGKKSNAAFAASSSKGKKSSSKSDVETPTKCGKPSSGDHLDVHSSGGQNSLSTSSSSRNSSGSINSPNTSVTVAIPANIVTLKSSPMAHPSPLQPSNTTSSTSAYHSISLHYLTEQDALAKAKTLKRNADREIDRHQKMLQYIEAVMYFIHTCLIMEAKRSESDMDRAYQIYKETLNLIKLTTSKFTKNSTLRQTDSSNMIDIKLTVFSYRCQALLNCRLNSMKQRDIHHNKELIAQFFSESSVAALLSHNSSNSSSTGTSTVPISGAVLNAFSKQLSLLQYSHAANDLWIKAEQMISSNDGCKKFFYTLEHDTGPLLLSSSFEHLINYTIKGIKTINL